MALLLDAGSQTVANLPAGREEPPVTIRTLSRTLYALLATLTTGRSFRGMETDGGRELAENSGSEIRDAASRATAGDERQSGKV